MCLLSPRFACTKCPQNSRCAAFVASDINSRTGAVTPRITPYSSSENCAGCGHPWISHKATPCSDPTHPNHAYRRGGYTSTDCGGFYSDSLTWSFLTACVCLAQWMSHALVESSSPTNAGPPSVSHPVPTPVTSASHPSLSVSAPIPVSAFGGLPAPIAGTSEQRRTESALRNLPQHQLASSSGSGSRTSRRPYPGGSNVFNDNVSIVVALWPLVIPGLHEPAGHGTTVLKSQNSNMVAVLNRLKQHHLLVTVNIPRTGLASLPDIVAQFDVALKPHKLSAPRHPNLLTTEEAKEFEKQPFILLSPTRREDVFTFRPHPSINFNTFGNDELTKTAKKFKNPLPNATPGQRLLFFAPTFGHINGPINDTAFSAQTLPSGSLDLAHPCFSTRVVDGLPLAGNAILPDPECMTGHCPEPSSIAMTPPPAQLAPMGSLVRARSPSDSQASPSSTRHVRQRIDSFPDANTAPFLISAFNCVAPATFPVLKRADVAPLVVGTDIASVEDVQEFHDLLARETIRASVPYVRRFDLHATTIDAAAQAIVPILKHVEHQQATDAVVPALEGIVDCSPIRSKQSFFREGGIIQLGVRESSNESVSFGPGPRQAVYRRAILLMVNNHDFWQQAPNSSFVVPLLSPGSFNVPTRTSFFTAYGSLLAIHCFTLSTGPHPVSIWVLLALALGRKGLLIPKEYLAALDPPAFECLAPWLMLGPDDTIPTHPLHPFNQFLMNVMDMQPSMMTSPRTQDEHDNWSISFMCKVLLGHANPFEHPEFRALQEGMDVAVGRTSFSLKLASAPEQALPFFAALYDRGIRQKKDITDHLSYRILIHAKDCSTRSFAALFRLLMNRFLDGTGYPDALRDTVVDAEEWSRQLNNTLLRVNLLLQAATDSDLLPFGKWKIQFNFVGVDTVAPESDPRPLHFHTCSTTVDVKITRALENLLLSSSVRLDDPTHCTAFDVWFQGQLMSRDHNTV
ncbi:hypothetical protein FB45DRAFT_1056053 [Roridomyces roridus]|uniref:Uncharacterized protein n=1 Tax=Roridomyces roridus TaxID=1738132 RepID=A0AAD7C229_9AGAR|nr:hypothetical protein FB45DRAFT_1056053 [Roridomyces roridus]